MAWLSSIFEGESMGAKLVVITISLVVVLLLLFWLFRKIAGSNKIRGSRNRRPRLAVTDAAVVDDKRRLVLVRRDNVEHLILIGGASDVLIEQNIIRVQSASPARPPVNAEKTDTTQIAPDSNEPDETPKPVGVSAGALAGGVATEAVSAATLSKQTEAELPKSDDNEVAEDAPKATKKAEAKVVIDPAPETKIESAKDSAKVETPTVKDVPPQPPVKIEQEKIEPKIIETKPVEPKTVESKLVGPKPDAIDNMTDLEADLSSEFGEMLTDEILEDSSLDFSPAKITTPEYSVPSADKKPQAPVPTPEPEVKAPPKPIAGTQEAPAPQKAPAPIKASAPQKQAAEKQSQPVGDDMEDEMQKLLRELSGEKTS